MLRYAKIEKDTERDTENKKKEMASTSLFLLKLKFKMTHIINEFMKSTKQNNINIERGITVRYNVKIITIQLNNAGVSIDNVVWSSSGHVVSYVVSWSTTAISYDAKFVWFR